MVIHLILILLFTVSASAQTPNTKEWLAKKKTQRQYFANQMVALQAFSEVLKKGYDIVGKGLNVVSAATGEENSGHSSRLLSLTSTNPSLNKNSTMTDARLLQRHVNKQFSNLISVCSSDGNFSVDEINYIKKVYSGVNTAGIVSIDELEGLFNGETTMTDDERLNRINLVKSDLNDQYSFTRSFCNSTLALGIQRAKEKHEISINRQL